jgi:membrane protease YdiL (CAAX protease family)
MTIKPAKTYIYYFFLFVFAFSVPFWILGTFVNATGILPINLPVAALMLFCPVTAAIILTGKADKQNGVKLLLKRVADYKIKNPVWYIPAFLLMPILMLLAYAIMKWLHISIPKQNIHLTDATILFVLFFIGAICEEVGWTGYITDPLQNQYVAFNAALIIGTVWAVWHIIPYSQAHRTPIWIFWQCASTVALRVIIVWLYNNTGKSLLAAILSPFFGEQKRFAGIDSVDN